MIRSLLRLLAGLMAVIVLSLPALAVDKAIIILDASGSMWAQIDGKSRIEIARETLKQVLAGVPADLELGFMAYGHRSKGDCNDIEMLVDPAPGTADAISAAADTLNPKGKTPLSASVKLAAEQLKYTENKATVILITDGIETCNADPCALASALEKDGVDFTVNVVGFGLSKDQGAQVKCLADNTGGKYISADDEAGLKSAIDAVVNNTPAPPPKAEPEPVSDITFAPTATLSEGDDPLVEGDGSVSWDFATVRTDGTPGEWVRTEFGDAYQGAIPPGEYMITAKLDYATVTQRMTIEAGKVARPNFDLEAGFLNLRPIHSEGADVDGGAAVYTEFPDGTSTTSYGEVKMYVPAGDTKVNVSIGAAKLDLVVTVTAGERVSKDIVVGAGHINASASYAEGMSADDGQIYFDVMSGKKDIQGNRTDFGGAYGPKAQFDLMPGDYVMVTTLDAVKLEIPFTVKAGEAVDLDVPLGAGVLALTLADDNDYLEVFGAKKDIKGNRVSFGGGYGPPISRTLPAGDYHLVLTLANSAGTKEADASVAAGERTETSIP
ncbi:MAG: VWA domain-containing protein [Devosia sp.]